MSLPAYEQSRFSGEPINLYLFRYGPAVDHFFAYTDAEQPQTIPTIFDDDDNPIEFQPIAIERSKISSSGTLDKANVTVTTAHDTALANLYLLYPPSYVTTLVMYQGHVVDEDQDFRVVWSGRVISCARKGSRAEFTCEPISTSLRRNGLRRRYQFGCPLVLYGDDCRASKEAATTETLAVSVFGSRVTLPDDWPDIANAAKYVQGLCEWTTLDGAREIRTVLRSENAGRTFLLSGTTRGLTVGTAVDMIYGCNHKSGTPAQSDGDCGPLHNNILNFGGQEFIPFSNPVATLRNSYY